MIVIVPYDFSHGRHSLFRNFYISFINKASLRTLILVTPSPPSLLGLVNSFHAAMGGFLALIYDPQQRSCLLYWYDWLIIVDIILGAHIQYVGSEESIMSIISRLPTYVRICSQPSAQLEGNLGYSALWFPMVARSR